MTPEHHTILSIITVVILLGVRALMIQNERNIEAEKEYNEVRNN